MMRSRPRSLSPLVLLATSVEPKIHQVMHSEAQIWVVGGCTRCVPGLVCKESGLIAAQGVLLLSRTWLTDYISRIEARAGRHLIVQVCPSHPPSPPVLSPCACLFAQAELQPHTARLEQELHNRAAPPL